MEDSNREVVVKEDLLRVLYKQILLLAPSRWLRTTHLTHLPIPRWEGLCRSRRARFVLHLPPMQGRLRPGLSHFKRAVSSLVFMALNTEFIVPSGPYW